MMRKFKLDNVVKVTDSEVKAKKYLAKGFTEVKEKPKPTAKRTTKAGE